MEEPQTERARVKRLCGQSDNLETVFTLGIASYEDQNYVAAAACFDLARDLDPGSAVPEFLAGRMAGLLKGHSSDIAHYRRAVELQPDFWEARFYLGIAQRLSGAMDIAEETYRATLVEAPPLPERRQVHSELTYLYTKANRRRDAATAQQAYVLDLLEEQKRYKPLDIAWSSVWNLSFELGNLAELEEEIGDYEGSAKHYAEAVAWASRTDKVGEASRFHDDLGRLRSVKRLGQQAEWKKGCDRWRKRFRVLRLRIMTRELEDIDWGGEKVATADLEATCGDFEKSLSLIEEEMERRTLRPYSFSHSVPATTYYAEAPFRALERIYRSRGLTDLANKVQEAGNRIEGARGDEKILQGLLREGKKLVQDGRSATIR